LFVRGSTMNRSTNQRVEGVDHTHKERLGRRVAALGPRTEAEPAREATVACVVAEGQGGAPRHRASLAGAVDEEVTLDVAAARHALGALPLAGQAAAIVALAHARLPKSELGFTFFCQCFQPHTVLARGHAVLVADNTANGRVVGAKGLHSLVTAASGVVHKAHLRTVHVRQLRLPAAAQARRELAHGEVVVGVVGCVPKVPCAAASAAVVLVATVTVALVRCSPAAVLVRNDLQCVVHFELLCEYEGIQ